MGRDLLTLYIMVVTLCFNPHARVGRDCAGQPPLEPWQGFNPHARVGRDCGLHLLAVVSGRFNPHARVGRDKLLITN